jgi:hypothetical protein
VQKERDGVFVDHLLLHCEVVWAIWNVFLSQFGLSWVMPRKVFDLYACWWTADNTHCKVVAYIFIYLLMQLLMHSISLKTKHKESRLKALGVFESFGKELQKADNSGYLRRLFLIKSPQDGILA